jgi:hypothetical protein
MFIIDDADAVLKLRHETKLCVFLIVLQERNVLFFWALSDRIDSLAEKMMEEPFFEIEEEEVEEELKLRSLKTKKKNNIK